MSQFETPSWGEENEMDKWAPGLFSSPNVKVKVAKIRKRNKYPKGFKDSDISTNVTKNPPPSKKKNNKRSNTLPDDPNEPPPKRKKPKENSTSGNVLNGSSTNESLPQFTPMEKNRKRKKNKKNLHDIKVKINKHLEELKTGQPSRVGKTIKDRSLYEAVAQNTAHLTENDKSRNKSCKKKKKKQKLDKRYDNPNEQSDPSNVSHLSLNEALDIPDKEETVEDSESIGKKRKKKHKKKVESTQEERLEIPDVNENVEGSKPIKKKKKKHKKTDESTQEERVEIPDANENLECSKPIKKKKKKQKKDESTHDEEYLTSEKHSENKDDLSSNLNDSFGIKNKKPTLREKMEEKLRGAKFRFLNEQLYTSKSQDMKKYFLTEPKTFKAYHEGYKQQLNQWPVKPIELIIRSLKRKPASDVIADFGCGEAQLAQSLPNKVHSFDHVALNDHVTVCDMAKTPLSKESVDVVVFCLSLMGSNLSDYIIEANRVLKIGGIMKIAEVESRFDDVNKFIRQLGKFGFLCTRQDSSNEYFILFDFRKDKSIKEGKVLPSLELRACSYKKR